MRHWASGFEPDAISSISWAFDSMGRRAFGVSGVGPLTNWVLSKPEKMIR
jgi:hypothetical protein